MKNLSPFIDGLKLGYRAKNAAFYTTESLNEPFFRGAKNENNAAGKKKKVKLVVQTPRGRRHLSNRCCIWVLPRETVRHTVIPPSGLGRAIT